LHCVSRLKLPCCIFGAPFICSVFIRWWNDIWRLLIVVIISISWLDRISTSIFKHVLINFLVFLNKILCLFLNLLLFNENFCVDWFLGNDIIWSRIWSLIVSGSRSLRVLSHQCCLWMCFLKIWFFLWSIFMLRPRAPLCLTLIHVGFIIRHDVKLFHLNILEIGGTLPEIIYISIHIILIIIMKLINF